MPWRALQSSHMNGADYDEETRTLKVQFTNGALYAAFEVPQTVVDTLHQVSSPGEFWHAKIKNNYAIVKLADGVTRSGRRSTRRY